MWQVCLQAKNCVLFGLLQITRAVEKLEGCTISLSPQCRVSSSVPLNKKAIVPVNPQL